MSALAGRLSAPCRISIAINMIAAVFYYASMSYLVLPVFSQGPVLLTFGSNPVYSGNNVTLTCSFDRDFMLVIVTIEAFNGTRKVGSANCIVPYLETTFDGVLAGSTFFGCPKRISRSGYAGISVRASPMLELDYNCSVRVTDGAGFDNVSSNASRLVINVWPEPPSFSPAMLVFNETDVSPYLVCTSRFGKPHAIMVLTVKQTNGRRTEHRRGNESVSFTLPTPLRDWHKAEALCVVENSESVQNSTTHGILTVNHITSRTDEVAEVHTYWSAVTLDCSKDIISFPGATFSWTINSESNSDTRNSGPSYTLPIGMSGSVICTATNLNNLRAIQITYKATGSIVPIVVIAVCSVMLVLVILAVVAYKRRCFPRRSNSHRCCNTFQQHSESSPYEEGSERLEA